MASLPRRYRAGQRNSLHYKTIQRYTKERKNYNRLRYGFRLTERPHQCHSSERVADRDPLKPFDRQAAVEQFYADLDDAKRLAFEKTADNGISNPDLVALPKILELQAKVYGLLSADGKRAPGGETVPVPLEEVEKLVRAAKLKLKEKKDEPVD